MTWTGRGPAVVGRALLVVTGIALACPPARVSAQSVSGLGKTMAKRDSGQLEAAVARLRDGWRQATLLVGEGAEPAVVAEAVARMIHDPVKLVGLGSRGDLEREENLSLKAAIVHAEERVRAAPQQLAGATSDLKAVRAETQRALDEYLAVLTPWLEAHGASPTGVRRP